jgi:hypothetical protein
LGADVFFSQAVDDLGAGGVAIAEDAGELRFLDERTEKILREAGRLLFEIAPVEGKPGSRPSPNGRSACPLPRETSRAAP